MLRNTLALAICGFCIAVVFTGCEPECVDRFDCRSRGANFICEDNRCVEGQPPGNDAGTDAGGEDPDGGMDEDAGMDPDAGGDDAGMDPDAGEDDGGTDPDAGTGCTSGNPVCEGTATCVLSADGGAGTCQPLMVAVTTNVGASATQAVLFTHTDPTVANRITLGTNSRFPRFSADGVQVVYVERPVNPLAPAELLTRPVHGANTPSLLVDSQDAGTADFVDLEYAPGPGVVWAMTDGGTTPDGIQFLIPGGQGGVQSAVSSGMQPDWSPIVNAFAFADQGIRAYVLPTMGSPTLTSDPQDFEPHVSPGGTWIAYLRGNATDPGVSNEIFITTAQMAFMPVRVTTAVPAVGTEADGGTPGWFAAHPAWAGSEEVLVYVTMYYYRDATGTPQPCDPGIATCGGAPGQVITFQFIDPTTAMPVGAPIETPAEGALPSVSPDGRWLAYVAPLQVGSRVRVTEFTLNPDAGTIMPGQSFAHDFPAGIPTTSDDYRPRWQPKLQ